MANSLLLSTGQVVAAADVTALHFAAGGTMTEGVTIARMLETVSAEGIGGVVPLSYAPADMAALLTEYQWLILGMTLTVAQQQQVLWDSDPGAPVWDGHAGVLDGGDMVTWGTRIPVTPAFLAENVEEAWAVRWQ